MLLGQDAGQSIAGGLVGALQHHAGALLGGREGGQDVGGGAAQADGVLVDEGMILQGVVVEDLVGLGVALEDAAHAHVTGGVQLLDAGDEAGGLDLDGHVAVLQHSLDGEGVALLGDLGGVGHLGQAQLLGDLGK